MNPLQQGMAVVQRWFAVAEQDVIDDRRHDMVYHLIDIERRLAARLGPLGDGREMFKGEICALDRIGIPRRGKHIPKQCPADRR